MVTDFSYTATLTERQRCENNDTLGVQWSRAETSAIEEKGRLPTSSKKTYGSEKTSGESPHLKSQNIYDSDSDQLKNVKDWNSNGNVGDGTVDLNLLPLQLGGRHKNGKSGMNHRFSFAL